MRLAYEKREHVCLYKLIPQHLCECPGNEQSSTRPENDTHYLRLTADRHDDRLQMWRQHILPRTSTNGWHHDKSHQTTGQRDDHRRLHHIYRSRRRRRLTDTATGNAQHHGTTEPDDAYTSSTPTDQRHTNRRSELRDDRTTTVPTQQTRVPVSQVREHQSPSGRYSYTCGRKRISYRRGYRSQTTSNQS